MEPDKFKYTIGGKGYIQKPLVLGQINQLIQVLKHVVIPKDADPATLIMVLGERLPKALAIVLLEESGVRSQEPGETAQYLKTRDLEALAGEITFNIDPETAMQAVGDFFDCNPIASLLERFAGMSEKLAGRILSMKETGPKASASSSPGETSQSGMPSSGDSPSRK